MPQQSGVLGGLLAHRLLGDADAGVRQQRQGREHGVVQQAGTLAALRLGLAGLPFGAVGGADAVDAAGDAGMLREIQIATTAIRIHPSSAPLTGVDRSEPDPRP